MGKEESLDFDFITLEQVVQVFAIYCTGALMSVVIIFSGELLFYYMKRIITKWNKDGKMLFRKVSFGKMNIFSS